MFTDVKSHATGFSMPKVNTIDFKNIFNNLGMLAANNPTVYSTVLVILLVYLVLLVWARRMDRRDIERVSDVSCLWIYRQGRRVSYVVSNIDKIDTKRAIIRYKHALHHCNNAGSRCVLLHSAATL